MLTFPLYTHISSLLVFSECPNYGAIIPCLLEHGIEELPKRCKLTPGKILVY
jgi:hypothetical protein